MKSPRRWALAGAILVLLLAGIGLGRSGREAPPTLTGGTAAASKAAMPATPSLWSMFLPASDASAPPDAAPEPPAEPAWTLRALRLRDDWCGFGMREQRRLMAQVASAGGADESDPDIERVQAWAAAQVSARWQAALRQRGDPRSLAVAEALSNDTSARSRLQNLARSSPDPMLTALALARPCEPGVCRNIEATQWSRLEPENLFAWLVQAKTSAGSDPQADYLLERMASVGRYARSYQQEMGQILLSVTLPDGPGLMQQTEAGMLPGVLAAQALPRFSPLTRQCRDGALQPIVAARCEAVAQALWSEGTLLERDVALAVARAVVPKSSTQRAGWERKARESEAVQQHEDGRLARMMGEVTDDIQVATSCEAGVVMQRWMRDFAGRSDWARARAELTAQGADLDALSRQWREKRGRSMLDPVPPQPAASR
jgi:hypothetical protein